MEEDRVPAFPLRKARRPAAFLAIGLSLALLLVGPVQSTVKPSQAALAPAGGKTAPSVAPVPSDSDGSAEWTTIRGLLGWGSRSSEYNRAADENGERIVVAAGGTGAFGPMQEAAALVEDEPRGPGPSPVFESEGPISGDNGDGQAALAAETTCNGLPVTISGTDADFEVIYGTEGNDVIHGQGGMNEIYGLGGNDTICGGPLGDTLIGGPGDDFLDGGDHRYDEASYSGSPGPITVDMAAGTVTGDGTDTLVNIEEVSGSAYDDTINGGPGVDRFWGRGGNDVINGLGGDDMLYGGDGDDTLDGGDGSDWLFGEGGADTLEGGASKDWLYGEGNSYTAGNDGGDTLNGGDGDDVMAGDSLQGSSDDTMHGGPGNETMWGGGGDDLIDGGDGPYDWVTFLYSSVPVTVDLAAGTATGNGTDTLVNIERVEGSNYDDTITGGPGNDWMKGNNGNDVINGGGGNDDLEGNKGDDTLNGDAGNDELLGHAGSDTLNGGPGYDSLNCQCTFGGSGGIISFDCNPDSNAAEGDDVLNGGDDPDGLVDGIGHDVMDGGDAADLVASYFGHDLVGDELHGGPGGPYDEDLLMSGPGDDLIDGGEGLDTVMAHYARGPVVIDLTAGTLTGHGNDTLTSIEGVRASKYDDTIIGSPGPDNYLFGDEGDDYIDGGEGDDELGGYCIGFWEQSCTLDEGVETLVGGPGDDVFPDVGLKIILHIPGGYEYLGTSDIIDGGDGADTISYWGSNVPVDVDLAAGTGTVGSSGGSYYFVDSLTSIENIRGSAWDDMLNGDDGANVIRGEDGDDTVNGRGGEDDLRGEEDDDYLDGGPAADLMNGGASTDTCVCDDPGDAPTSCETMIGCGAGEPTATPTPTTTSEPGQTPTPTATPTDTTTPVPGLTPTPTTSPPPTLTATPAGAPTDTPTPFSPRVAFTPQPCWLGMPCFEAGSPQFSPGTGFRLPTSSEVAGASVESMALPAGCSPVVSTYADSTAVVTVGDAVSPAGILISIWRFEPTFDNWLGSSPRFPQMSDLSRVDRLDVAFICLSSPGTWRRPII